MKVYLFEYCSCTHESAFGLKSVHATAKGARDALKAHRAKEEAWAAECGLQIQEWQQWRVRPVKVRL